MEAGQRLACRLVCRSFSSYRQGNAHVPLTTYNVRWMSAFPRLESATARARKRRRRVARLESLKVASSRARAIPDGRQHKPAEDDVLSPYPEGKPWRVLWPNPHGNPAFVVETKPVRRIPRWRDLRSAWGKYLETWEDGIQGVPSPEKLRQREALESSQSMAVANPQKDVSSIDKMQSNVSKNMQVARDSAKDLLEQAKGKTDVYSRDDLQRVAGDMMKLATECLKEFMAGYRTGRDQEVDKMLHEYFQDEKPDTGPIADVPDTSVEKKSKRRKPRRATLR